MFRNVIIFLFVLGAAVLVARWIKRPKRIFEARVGEDQVAVRGPVPHHSQEAFSAYVATLRLPVGARIAAIEDSGSYRLEFSSSIRTEDREKVERFLRSGLPTAQG